MPPPSLVWGGVPRSGWGAPKFGGSPKAGASLAAPGALLVSGGAPVTCPPQERGSGGVGRGRAHSWVQYRDLLPLLCLAPFWGKCCWFGVPRSPYSSCTASGVGSYMFQTSPGVVGVAWSGGGRKGSLHIFGETCAWYGGCAQFLYGLGSGLCSTYMSLGGELCLYGLR